MKIDRINKLKNITVNRKALATILGFKNENYINSLVRLHGAPRSIRHNEYNLVEFYRWFVGYKNKLAADEINRIQNQSAKDSLALANIKLKDLQLEQLRSKLIPKSEVIEAYENEIALFRYEMNKLQGMLKDKLVNLSDQKEVATIINDSVNVVFTNIANSKIGFEKKSIRNNSKTRSKRKKNQRL